MDERLCDQCDTAKKKVAAVKKVAVAQRENQGTIEEIIYVYLCQECLNAWKECGVSESNWEPI